MSRSGGPGEERREEWYASRRKRSTSLVRYAGVLSAVLGFLTIGVALSNLYEPTVEGPIGIDPSPLFGLTNIAGAGITAVLFGGLLYLYAVRAGV